MKLTPIISIILVGFLVQLSPQKTHNNEIHQKVEKIYSKLKNALGDKRSDWPKLEISEYENSVASFNPAKNKLVVEAKAYNICQKLGDKSESALAFLIGHEMTHFYQEHDWQGEGFMMKTEHFHHHQQHEQEADIHGAFIAYLAGYSIEDVIPATLDKIYEGYHLSKNLPNYPSLEERKKVADKAMVKTEQLIDIYETATYFAAVGWHKEAAFCYDYLLKQTKTKELYNNLGTVLLSAGLVLAKKEGTAKFSYPIELDTDFKVLRDEGRGSIIDKTQLLNMAVENFDKAIKFDRRYFSAYINLACTFDLLRGEKGFRDPWDYLKKAGEVTSSSSRTKSIQESKVAILKGILFASEKKMNEATEQFNLAVKHSWDASIDHLAKDNRKILKSGATPNYSKQPTFQIEDAIAGLNYYRASSLNAEVGHCEKIELGKIVGRIPTIQLKNDRKTTLSYVRSFEGNSADEVRMALHRTRDSSEKTHRNVGVNSSVSVVKKAYAAEGDDYKIVNCKKGYFLIYPRLCLIFRFDKNQDVEEWGVFTSR